MNIIAQCCGLLILFVILYFSLTTKPLKLKTSKAFFIMIAFAIVCIVLDILSVFVITNSHLFSKTFVDIICKLYLVALVSTAYSTLDYIYCDIYARTALRRKKALRQGSIFMIAEVIIMIVPIEWVHEGRYVYSEGPANYVTYAICLYCMWKIIHLVFKNWNNMNTRRRNAVTMWVMLWVVAAAVQFFVKWLLLVSYAGAIGVFVIYLMLENPDSYIDKRTGFFNQKGFEEYIKTMYAENKKFSVYLIVVEDLSDLKEGNLSEADKKRQEEFVAFLNKLPGTMRFCDSDDQIMLVFDDNEHGKAGRERLDAEIHEQWGKEYSIYAKAEYFYVPDGSFTNDVYSFMKLLRYARQNNNDDLRRRIVTIDRKIFDDMVSESVVEALIVDAISNGRIEIYYQPIYSTDKKRFTSAEALVRIRDEEGTIVPPAKFIGVAEENGMIIKLGELIFEKVCEFISSDSFEELGLDYVEINLSVVQCCYRHLASDYKRIMKKYNVDPSKINLEITESASIEGKNLLIKNMQDLIDYGVKFSLDDFGTGQSNLNYIAEMPVDIVKFDRDMTKSYFENDKAQYVMDAAMSMIKGMKLEIVSEGIETPEQCETMKDLGIGYIQGYYFSKPLPQEEFVQFLIAENNKQKMS